MKKSALFSLTQLLRYDILTSTSAAGSGHPTTSLSAVELMAVLFFAGHFHYDLKNPRYPLNDRLIFSKGHASPLLYALYHAAGVLSQKELLTLRQFDSVLEGHPTPRFPYVDVATGSLGQGLSIGVGMAMGIKYNAKRKTQNVKPEAIGGRAGGEDPAAQSGESTDGRMKRGQNLSLLNEPKVFVLLGDSEAAEGQVWEAAEIASFYKLNNLVAILDVNRLGQRGETMLGWDLRTYEKRFSSFGWKTIVLPDGHDITEINKAYIKIEQTTNDHRPTMIIAKTVKGKGVSFLENKDGWHGKALKADDLQKALKELGKVDLQVRGKIAAPSHVSGIRNQEKKKIKLHVTSYTRYKTVPGYKLYDKVATREAYGDALADLGKQSPLVVALDAETSNSTFSEKLKITAPSQFFEMYIAEQNMVSAALGFAKLGFVPFVSSFAAFLTRAFDQIRMGQYSEANLKIVGSHAGVSIGSDGSSQMALEDLAMMRSILDSVVLYPGDAVSTYQLMGELFNHQGISYLRLTREKTPVLYSDKERFKIGGCKVHKINITKSKVDALILAAGITLHEALKAQAILTKQNINTVVVDCYSVKPLDEKTIIDLAKKVKKVIVVEDHYPYGGLGEAVKNTLADNFQFAICNFQFTHLAVRRIPRSGTPEELLAYEKIDDKAICKAVIKK